MNSILKSRLEDVIEHTLTNTSRIDEYNWNKVRLIDYRSDDDVIAGALFENYSSFRQRQPRRVVTSKSNFVLFCDTDRIIFTDNAYRSHKSTYSAGLGTFYTPEREFTELREVRKTQQGIYYGIKNALDQEMYKTKKLHS